MQVQSTTRRCSRCKNDLPIESFGSHNYCRACYREYLDNWRSKNPAQPTRRQAARQRLKDGLCVVCETTPSRSGLCNDCHFGAQFLGIDSDNFEDNILNLLDWYNHVFDK
jgi:hypothetical protein